VAVRQDDVAPDGANFLARRFYKDAAPLALKKTGLSPGRAELQFQQP